MIRTSASISSMTLRISALGLPVRKMVLTESPSAVRGSTKRWIFSSVVARWGRRSTGVLTDTTVSVASLTMAIARATARCCRATGVKSRYR